MEIKIEDCHRQMQYFMCKKVKKKKITSRVKYYAFLISRTIALQGNNILKVVHEKEVMGILYVVK